MASSILLFPPKDKTSKFCQNSEVLSETLKLVNPKP